MVEKTPTVLIVGKPNVGKSTIFNRMIGSRKAIVDKIPGVTIDTIYGNINLDGMKITVIDTWGITQLVEEDEITFEARKKTIENILKGDLILFVVDGKEGLSSDDFYIAELLRKTGIKVLLVANKTENIEKFRKHVLFDLYSLGFGEPIEISAAHSKGIGELLERIKRELEELGFKSEEEPSKKTDEKVEAVKIAIVGRPNVGKSSIFNRILKQDRAIVTTIPGTTKDSIDETIVIEGKRYTFIDTAGMRRKSKIEMKTLESFGVLRAVRAIERADVVLLVLDASDGVKKQDQKIAGLIERRKKASLILFNKSDLLNKEEMNILRKQCEDKLYFISYSPLLFISAKTGYGIDDIIPSVDEVYGSYSSRVPTSVVNVALRRFLILNPTPIVHAGRHKRLKLYYGSQVDTKPPVFLFFVNDVNLIEKSFERKIENMIRRMISPFKGTPIVVKFKQRR